MPISSCIHVFIFPHVLESSGMFWSSILHVFNFFSSICMPSPPFASHRNVVVHYSDHSLFHYVHARCAFILLAEPCFVLGWSPVVTILSRAKVWGILCLLNEWAVEITRFYEKEWSFMVSLVLLCNGLLCHRVEWNPFLLCWNCGLLCVHIFPWSELVWSGNWVWTSLINLV